METVLKKNEAEINENAAKGLLCVFAFVLLVAFFCWVGFFDIYTDMTVIMLTMSFITLVIPAVMILKMHIYSNGVKYTVVTAVAIMAGTTYVLFTFQAILVFVIPTMIVALYLNKKLLYYSGGLTIVTIAVSHFLTGLNLFLPHLEPFSDMGSIIRYGVIPRCIQYCGFFLLVVLLTNRYEQTVLHIVPAVSASENGVITKENSDKESYDAILKKLTERERSVFSLMVMGCTNMQIAEKLYLSNGTVKNYISVIYEKIGTKERNALIIKYGVFASENDRSHIRK